MRKQWIALLLCLCLLCASMSSLADVAVKESTQLDKLKGHWMNSSFQGELKGSATQDGPAFVDPILWSVFRAYLQDYTVSFTHTNQNSTADLGSEDVLTLEDASGAAVIQTILAQDANGILIPHDRAEESMDAAACVGCGACVATCKNGSAMLFVAARVSSLALLPQGRPEAARLTMGGGNVYMCANLINDMLSEKENNQA